MEGVYFKGKEGERSPCEETAAVEKYRLGSGAGWMGRNRKQKIVNKIKTKGQFHNIKCQSGQSGRGSTSPIKYHLHADVTRYLFPDDRESVTLVLG